MEKIQGASGLIISATRPWENPPDPLEEAGYCPNPRGVLQTAAIGRQQGGGCVGRGGALTHRERLGPLLDYQAVQLVMRGPGAPAGAVVEKGWRDATVPEERNNFTLGDPHQKQTIGEASNRRLVTGETQVEEFQMDS
ncbi:hypothetical protein NDU88_002263 [Pleurodeles waltl]|uniref:Uncharacterized protein n=1 Tax=Pleurodeles waltl TaxID=8319 RepID=A0AAV7WPD5_PLEWA|nr:hypothetical protein NDU88_002263 [Pleurodeles waltl]